MICAISWTTTLCIKSRSNFKIFVHMLLQFTFKIWINKMKIYDYPVVHNKVDISAYWTRVVGQENSFMLQEMNVKKVWNQYKRWWRKTKIKFWNSQQSNNPNLYEMSWFDPCNNLNYDPSCSLWFWFCSSGLLFMVTSLTFITFTKQNTSGTFTW